jgi:hypothetical protein
MKMFVDAPEIYLHRYLVDFRKQINSLTAIVELEMKRSLNTRALFLFCSKRRDKLKLLYWDKTGFCLWYKRLATLELQLSKQNNVLKNKDHKIQTLEEYIRYMVQQRFGSSSEKLSVDQINLFDESELLSDNDTSVEENSENVPAHKRKTSETDWMLGDFSGALMTDGYAVYDSVCKSNQLENLGCWAHARRYFKEARDAQGKEKASKANTALAFIQKLFRIEKLSENQSIDEKYQTRQTQTVPLLEQLRQWLDKTLQRPINSDKLKKAVTYLHNQWPKLIRYMENSAWPINNNAAKTRFVRW